MQTQNFEVGPNPFVKIEAVRGDLRLSGRQGGQLEVKAYSDEVNIDQDGDSFTIHCPSDCLIFLPSESRIEGDSIGGDVRATNIRGEMSLGTVGGDLSLRSFGKTECETIGGNFLARKGTGDIHITRIGGDAVIDRISGSVSLNTVGGDLRLGRVDGDVDVSAGGDTSITFTTLEAEKVSANAGGDLFCSLPKDASAKVTLSSGGEAFLPEGMMSEGTGGEHVFTLGDGGTEVDIFAGGDLWFQVGESSDFVSFADLGESIASRVESDLEAGIAEMEARLEALDAGLGTFSSERIGEQVRRAVTRARRKAERGRRHASQAREHAFRKRHSIHLDLGKLSGEKQAVSEDERLSILRMLEKGTVTVEEAEKLLQALEGEL